MAWTATGAAEGAEVPEAAKGHTVGVFPYYMVDDKQAPAGAFSGLLIDERFVVTDRASLERGNTNPLLSTKRGNLVQVFITLHHEGKVSVAPCQVSVHGQGLPVAVLEVNEADQPTLRAAVGKPLNPAKLDVQLGADVVGVVAPPDLPSGMLNANSVPAPIALNVFRDGLPSMIADRVPGSEVSHALPMAMAGGGVWDDEHRLIGVLVRYRETWMVLDPLVLGKELGLLARPVTPTPKPPDVTPTPTPTPAKRSELAGLRDVMREYSLEMKVDPYLLDYVKQDQADIVMAYLAGGEPDEALSMLNDIEGLASGVLADQLKYRRALAQAMKGEYEKAASAAQEAMKASDELVRARARLLFKTLDGAEGKFEGKPLSDPDVLVAAMKATLGELDKLYRSSFTQLQSLQLNSSAAYRSITQKIETLSSRLAEQRLAWPNYFDALAQEIVTYGGQVRQVEHRRAREELRALLTEYRQQKAQAQYMRGREWAQEGWWPEVRVGKANVAANQYNELLEHYRALDASLPEAQRVALPEGMDSPLPRLEAARRVDRR